MFNFIFTTIFLGLSTLSLSSFAKSSPILNDSLTCALHSFLEAVETVNTDNRNLQSTKVVLQIKEKESIAIQQGPTVWYFFPVITGNSEPNLKYITVKKGNGCKTLGVWYMNDTTHLP